MLKKDLISKSPVSVTIGTDNLKNSKFGAVLSRAGVGKTSFLVQIALTRMLDDRKILHISFDDPIEKINLRYKEAYQNLIDYIGYVDPLKADVLWEDIKVLKVGICYNENTFDTAKIQDYLKSFTRADMDLPSIIVIDGLNFDRDVSGTLAELKAISNEYPLSIWFSIQNHREEPLCDDGYPIQLEAHNDLFDKAVMLQPVDSKLEAVILKDGNRTDQKTLLQPANLMPVD